MSISEKSKEIAQAFTKYADTGDKSLIEKYNKIEEIELAIIQDPSEERWPYQKAMKTRVNELRDKRNKKEKWKDRIIGFVLGMVSGILLKLMFK